MQTVPASVILDDAYRLIGWDADQLDTREQGDARMALSLALQELWEEWWWEEVMACQKRQCARTYAAATANAELDVVLYPPTDKYYICILANTGQAPATDSGGGNYTLNSQYWIEAQESWSGDTYEAGTPVNSEREVGTVYYVAATDDYQVFRGLAGFSTVTVSGAGTAAANGTYTATAWHEDGAVATYTNGGYTLLYTADNGAWLLISPADVPLYANNASASPFSGTWFVVTGSNPAPTVTETVPGTSIYLALPEFHPTLPYTYAGTDYEHVADVRKIARFDPRCHATPAEFGFFTTADGVRICDLDIGRPWVWSRRPTPVLTGTDYDADTAYEATDPQDLVFDS